VRAGTDDSESLLFFHLVESLSCRQSLCISASPETVQIDFSRPPPAHAPLCC
jgi:hypothetical protein